jgi:hypothetical protein
VTIRMPSAGSTYLDEGLKLFDRSVASLQYLIEEEMGALARDLFLQGVEALNELTARKRFGTERSSANFAASTTRMR